MRSIARGPRRGTAAHSAVVAAATKAGCRAPTVLLDEEMPAAWIPTDAAFGINVNAICQGE